MMEVLHNALLGFFIAFTKTSITFSLTKTIVMCHNIKYNFSNFFPYNEVHEQRLTIEEALDRCDTTQTALHHSVIHRP